MELDPFDGGGFGVTVRALAGLLTTEHEVTIVATSANAGDLAALAAAGDPRLTPGVRYVGVTTPDDHPGCVTPEQGTAASVLDGVVGAYPGAGPDVVVSADYLGLAAYLIAAARTGHRTLRRTRFVVRTAGTAELCAIHNYALGDDIRNGVMHALERQCLRDADLLWTQSDSSIEAYQRHYGAGALAPHAVLPTPELEAPVVARRPPVDGEPLRLLYLGRLERRKGILDLIDGFTRVADEGWTLTLAGSDTRSAPGGHSVADVVAAIGDDRVEVRGPVARADVPTLLAAHDVYVAPSPWETWGHSPCEALRAGLPAVVTPTGGFPEMVAGGRFGWVCADTGAAALADGLRRVLADRERARALRLDPELPAHAARLADPEPLLAAIDDLGRRPPDRRARRTPRVTAVVPYFAASEWIGDTLASLRDQTYPDLEILVVNDGSLHAGDAAVYDAAERCGATVVTTLNRGPCAARNLGVRHASGEHVVFLDADNVAEPEWVARLVEVAEANPGVGYVSSWLRMIDTDNVPVVGGQWSRYCPIGIDHPVVEQRNVAGDQAALVPRARFVDDGIWFEESMFLAGDWEYYRALRQAGRRGIVIPEELVRYRLHAAQISTRYPRDRHSSPPELAASLTKRRTRWTTEPARSPS